MHRRVIPIVIAGLLAILTLSGGANTLAELGAPDDVARNLATASVSTNLLANADFDGSFYERPPNHFVAWPWFEWWADHVNIPEYIDGGIPQHNECYPKPADGLCYNTLTGYRNSSQGYILYDPANYKAGIYQPVTTGIVQCTPYTFEIWNRNDATYYHAKVAIDTSGWIITQLGSSLPNNCPPTGTDVCPDPYVASFPATTVWSAESNHEAYTWAPISVTAEAITNKISVWTLAAPNDPTYISQSTYWDYASLVQASFPDNRLPAPASWSPSGFITNVTTEVNGNDVTIDWDTLAPASTQVWYALYPPSETPSPSPLPYQVYLPLMSGFKVPSTYMTPLITAPSTSHHVVITGLPADQTLVFVALSRRPDGSACTTEVSSLYQLTISTNHLAVLDSSKAPAMLAEPIVAQP